MARRDWEQELKDEGFYPPSGMKLTARTYLTVPCGMCGSMRRTMVYRLLEVGSTGTCKKCRNINPSDLMRRGWKL